MFRLSVVRITSRTKFFLLNKSLLEVRIQLDHLDFHPAGNYQRGYYFYIIKNGKKISCNIRTPFPLPDYVIDHLHAIYHNDPKGNKINWKEW